jgi:hypothetical protein
MKVSVCLHGQPRLYMKGYENIQQLVKNNTQHTFDFFYHTYYSETLVGTSYKSSNYRYIEPNELIIEKNIIQQLCELYKPKSYSYDAPIQFDLTTIEKSQMYDKCSEREKTNGNNCVSNIYSVYSVSKLLKQYVEENNVKYDLIITIRFDFLGNLGNINLDLMNNSHFSTSYVKERVYIVDSIVISNYTNFILYASAYNNLHKIINNKYICELSKRNNNGFTFVPECVVTCNLYYYFNERISSMIDNRHDIPNFI